MGLATVCFDVLEALPCVVLRVAEAIVGKNLEDLLIFAGGNDLFAIAGLQAYCVAGGHVMLHKVWLMRIAPEGGLDVGRHRFGHPMLNVAGQHVWVDVCVCVGVSAAVIGVSAAVTCPGPVLGTFGSQRCGVSSGG